MEHWLWHFWSKSNGFPSVHFTCPYSLPLQLVLLRMQQNLSSGNFELPQVHFLKMVHLSPQILSVKNEKKNKLWILSWTHTVPSTKVRTENYWFFCFLKYFWLLVFHSLVSFFNLVNGVEKSYLFWNRKYSNTGL